MEIKTLLFGCGDLLLGLLALCLQISTYALYGTGNPSDAASVGIWGGVCFILTATFILSYRSKIWIRLMAILSLASGLVMIGLYSWRLYDLTKHYSNGICSLYTIQVQYDYCGEVTVAAFYVVDGILAVILNSFIFPLAGTFY